MPNKEIQQITQTLKDHAAILELTKTILDRQFKYNSKHDNLHQEFEERMGKIFVLLSSLSKDVVTSKDRLNMVMEVVTDLIGRNADLEDKLDILTKVCTNFEERMTSAESRLDSKYEVNNN